MGLLNLLPSSPLGLKGATPAQREGAKNTSTLHLESSINDNPDILQQPSNLDLDGKRPSAYMDNPPK
jgi:hypothetical protein